MLGTGCRTLSFMHPLHAALDRTWPALVDLGESIPDDRWTDPSILPDWTIADVYAHLGHLEGLAHDFEQPDVPTEWTFEGKPLHHATNSGVAARRNWTRDQVLDEVRRASRATLDRLESLDESGWEQPAVGPLGPTTLQRAMELRVGDAYAHYLDLLVSLDLYDESRRIPEAEEVLVERAVRLSGWAAVKRAGLPDGTRVRLDLSGTGARRVDLVVEDRRGRLEEPSGEPDAAISGPAIGFALRAGGRDHPRELTGAVDVRGEPAERLLEEFGLFE